LQTLEGEVWVRLYILSVRPVRVKVLQYSQDEVVYSAVDCALTRKPNLLLISNAIFQASTRYFQTTEGGWYCLSWVTKNYRPTSHLWWSRSTSTVDKMLALTRPIILQPLRHVPKSAIRAFTTAPITLAEVCWRHQHKEAY
jgi:hypothetical protein